MTRSGACATLATGAILALGACKSFTLRTSSDDPGRVRSLYVIVGPGDKLEHDTVEKIKNLVRSERLDTYPFLAHFRPDQVGSWEGIDKRGSLEPEVDGARISLKIAASFIEVQRDPHIALVVRFQDDTWKCAARQVIAKGLVEYRITATDLVAQL